MPVYIFEDDRDGSIHEVILTMKEEHRAFAPDGYELKRIFVNPQTTISSTSKLDPFDSKAFVNLTKEKKGTIGNLEDLAREKSLEREKKLGFDPVKEANYKKYSDIRGGKIHPEKRKEKLAELKSKPIELKIKK